MRNSRKLIRLLTLGACLAGFSVSVVLAQPAPPGVFRPQASPPPTAAAPPPQAVEAQKRLMKGLDYRKKGNINAAIVEFKAVVKLFPKVPVGYYQLGSAYMAKNDLRSAEPMFAKVADLVPKDPGILLQLMQINAQLNRPEQAASYGARAVKLKPKDSRIHFALGNLYLQQRNLTAAAREYQTVTQLDPKAIPAYYNLAMIYSQKQNWAGARQALAKVAALNPKDDRIVGMRADIEEKADKVNGPKKAIEIVKKALASRPNSPQLQFSLGVMYEKTKQPQLALQSYQKVIAKAPSFAPAKLNAARLLLNDQKAKDRQANIKKASSYLKDALKQMPDNPQALTMLGFAELQTGDNKNAEVHYKKAQKLDPNNLNTMTGLAYIYQTSNRQKEAISVVEKMRSLNADDAALSLRLAGLYDSAGDKKKAGALYQQTVEKFPKNTDAMVARATWLQQQKELDKAAEQYRAVLKIKPDDMDTQLKIAYLYSGSEDKAVRDKAIPEFEAAKKLALKAKTPEDTKNWDNRLNPFEGLANVYSRDNDTAKAANQYVEFIQAVPKNTQARQMLAQLYEKDDANLDKAAEQYRELIKIDPSNGGYYTSLANVVKKKSGKDEDEIAEYRKFIEADPKNLTPRYVLAEKLAGSKDASPDAAIKEYNEILNIKSDDSRALVGLADIYEKQATAATDPAEKQKKADDAIALYKKAVEANPGMSFALRRVQSLIVAKNDPKATEDWLAYLKTCMTKKDMQSPTFYAIMLDEYGAAKRGQEAVSAIQEVGKKNAKDVQPALAIANYYEKNGRQAEALAAYKKILGTQGVFENNKGDAYKGIGNVYFAQGKYKDALRAYQNWKSRQMFFMGVDQTQLRIAQCLEYTGQASKALAEYKNMQNGGSQDPQITQQITEAINRLSPSSSPTPSNIPTAPGPGLSTPPPMPAGPVAP